MKKTLLLLLRSFPALIFAQSAKRAALADTSDMGRYNAYIKPIKYKIAKLTASFMKTPVNVRVSKKYQDSYQPKFDSQGAI